MAKDLFYGDADSIETQEWMEAFESVLENEGPDRARYLLERLSEKAHTSGVRLTNLNTPYINTIARFKLQVVCVIGFSHNPPAGYITRVNFYSNTK